MRSYAVKTHLLRPLLLTSLALAVNSSARPQETGSPRALTADDYARAEKFMGYNTNRSVYHEVRPEWTSGERLWYRDTDAAGVRFVTFDAATLTKAPAFEHAKLAVALSAASGRFSTRPTNCRFEKSSFRGTESLFRSTLAGAGFSAIAWAGRALPGTLNRRREGRDRAAARATKFPHQTRGGWHSSVITICGCATPRAGKRLQLTTDGVKDFGYALDNAGWEKSDHPILLWSPDSKKIATFQQDQRNVGEMYLVETKVGHPALQAWKYPLPGDDHIATIQRVILDVEMPRVIRAANAA